MADKTDSDTKFTRDMENAATVVARRRLLKAGLGSGAVLMTIKTRSALACTTRTCTYGATTPSAFGSMNMSPGHEVTSYCMGRSHGYWKTHTTWPAGYTRTTYSWNEKTYPATTFGDVFAGGSDELSKATLLEVLNLEGGAELAMARDLVAAVLNAASGLTNSVLPVDRVKTIWTEYATRGYYEPVAGIRWYSNSTWPTTTDAEHNKGIVGYLQSTYN